MREALASLTVRGRSFLAGGITALICGIALGQPPLVTMGVLALSLPLLAAFAVARTHHELALERTVSPTHVEPGRPAHVNLELTNESRAPTGTLLLEENVGHALGTRPRFVVRGVRRGWRRTLHYSVSADVRGRHEVGPMTMRITDPFGLVEVGRIFQTHDTITVVPRTVPLTPRRRLGGQTGSGDHLAPSFTSGSPEDVSVREYQRGDDLRRVHWRSSARSEKLMVRREEQPWQARTTLVLDNRALAHRGPGPASTLEEAVSVAASIAAHLVGLGHDVRLATAAGTQPWNVPHRHATPPAPHTRLAPLLDALAGVELDPRTTFDTTWVAGAHPGGQVIAVLGVGLDADQHFLDRVRHRATRPVAIVLDVPLGTGPGVEAPMHATTAPRTVTPQDRVNLLTLQGWRAALLRRDTRLEQSLDRAWQEVAR